MCARHVRRSARANEAPLPNGWHKSFVCVRWASRKKKKKERKREKGEASYGLIGGNSSHWIGTRGKKFRPNCCFPFFPFDIKGNVWGYRRWKIRKVYTEEEVWISLQKLRGKAHSKWLWISVKIWKMSEWKVLYYHSSMWSKLSGIIRVNVENLVLFVSR